jgi:hypothetical protein
MKVKPLSIEDRRQALDFKIRTVAQRQIKATQTGDKLTAKALKQELEGLIEKRQEMGEPSEIRNLPFRRQMEILNKKIDQARREADKIGDEWTEEDQALARKIDNEFATKPGYKIDAWIREHPHREKYRVWQRRMDEIHAKVKRLEVQRDNLIASRSGEAVTPDQRKTRESASKIVNQLEFIARLETDLNPLAADWVDAKTWKTESEKAAAVEEHKRDILGKRMQLRESWYQAKKEGLHAADVLDVFDQRLGKLHEKRALIIERGYGHDHPEVRELNERIHQMQLERQELIGAVRQEYKFVPTISTGEDKPFHHGTGITETIGILKNKGTLKGRMSGWGARGPGIGRMPMGGGIIPQLSWMGEDITKDPLVFVSPHAGTPYNYGKTKTGYSILTGKTTGDQFDYTYQHGPPFVVLEGRIPEGQKIYHGIPRDKTLRKKLIGKRFPEVVVKNEIPNFLRKIRIAPEVILDEEGQEMIRLATEAGYPVEVISTPGERFDRKKTTGKNVWRQTAAQRQFSRVAQGKAPIDQIIQADVGSIMQRKGLSPKAKEIGKKIEELQQQVDPYSTNRKKQGELEDQIQDLRNQLQEELPKQAISKSLHDPDYPFSYMSESEVLDHAEFIMDDVQRLLTKPNPDRTDVAFLRQHWNELGEIAEGLNLSERYRNMRGGPGLRVGGKAYLEREAKVWARINVITDRIRDRIGGVKADQYIQRKRP